MKNIVITGATGAVGKATAFELAKEEGLHLILAGRNSIKLNEVKNEIVNRFPSASIDIIEADLNSLASIENAAVAITKKYPQLFALLNIAAVFKNKKFLNKNGHETMFATNHLGPFYLTTLLKNTLDNTPGSRVLTVTAPSNSKIDFTNLQGEKKFSAFGAFGASKRMNLLFAFKLAQQLQNTNHASMAFFPGLVRSELMDAGPRLLYLFLKLVSSKPLKPAKAITQLILKEDARKLNGKFYNKKLKELKGPANTHDKAIQQKLWEVSEKLTTKYGQRNKKEAFV
jgi:NAD(P)-dependent dehydrogenase (short-subunit alcohol dehydrogenase family)